MQHIESYDNFLNEGLSPLLYHFTGLNSLLNIIETDKLIASSAITGANDGGSINNNKHFYISFQRSKSGKIGYATNSGKYACLVFDGVKLKNLYAGKPVDWYKKSKDVKDYGNISRFLRFNELEDRVTLDVPYIDNVRKYILEVHTIINSGTPKTKYLKLEKYCELLGIQLFLYWTEEDFLNQKKSAAIKVSDITPAMLAAKPKSKWDKTEDLFMEDESEDIQFAIDNIRALVPFYVYKDIANREKIERIFPEEKFGNLFKGIGNYHTRVLKNNNPSPDSIRLLKTDLYAVMKNLEVVHNPYILEFFKLLSQDMRRYKAITMDAYVDNKLEMIRLRREQGKN